MTTPRAARGKTRNGNGSSATPATLAKLAPGVSLGELSRRTGIAGPHLSRVLNGKRGLTVRIAKRISAALEIEVGRVIEELAA